MDELVQLVDKINGRKVMEWQMQLAIVENPHKKDPKKLWETLKNYGTKPYSDRKLDKSSFAALRFAMSKSPSFVVK